MTSENDASDSMLSRSGRSNPDGKLTARLDVPVSEEIHEMVIALSALNGVPKAEYVRSILERTLLGEMSMMRRIARVGALSPSDKSQ